MIFFSSHSIVYLLILSSVLFGAESCKKTVSSANHVIFSFNDSLKATCVTDVRPNFDFLGGPNCEFQFDRIGKFATGESAEIGFFTAPSCELKTSPLPFQTQYFNLAIVVYQHPWDPITYSYIKSAPPDTMSNTPGNMTLTITTRTNNIVKGTITGTIWGSTGAGLANNTPYKFDCTIDLEMPLLQ